MALKLWVVFSHDESDFVGVVNRNEYRRWKRKRDYVVFHASFTKWENAQKLKGKLEEKLFNIK